MNAKETRKKLQRTIVNMVDKYPEKIVRRELNLVMQTLEGVLTRFDVADAGDPVDESL